MIFQDLTGAWQFRQTGSEDWLPATVPGGRPYRPDGTGHNS